jgi:hypothetical protein
MHGEKKKKNRCVFFLSSLHKVDELNAYFVLEPTQTILLIWERGFIQNVAGSPMLREA